MTTDSSQIMDADDRARLKNRQRGIAYARYAGIGVGVFLLAWLPFNSMRWGGEAPAGLLPAETVIFGIIAILLVLPWKKIEAGRYWKPLVGFFFFMVAAFAFTMVIDMMFQYILAANQDKKPMPPAFQSFLLFVILMQPAVLIFQRRPDLLD